MIWFLRVLFGVFFVTISATVIWACFDTPLWAIPPEVTGDAWFQATMVDIYISFLTFYVWVAYKEPSWPARLLWLGAIVCLGSIAVTTFCLRELCRVPAHTPLAEVLLRRTSRAP